MRPSSPASTSMGQMEPSRSNSSRGRATKKEIDAAGYEAAMDVIDIWVMEERERCVTRTSPRAPRSHLAAPTVIASGANGEITRTGTVEHGPMPTASRSSTAPENSWGAEDLRLRRSNHRLPMETRMTRRSVDASALRGDGASIASRC